VATILYSEKASDLMTRVRRTCGKEQAYRVANHADMLRANRESESNMVFTHDITDALEALKLTKKVERNVPYVDPNRKE
jgi:hypothetical protein